jgi:hypothetical protein
MKGAQVAKSKDSKKVTPLKRISDSQIFKLVEIYVQGKAKENTGKAEAKKAQNAITAELAVRKTKSLTAANGTTVTYVQPEGVEYDSEGLYADLSPKQRREAYEDNINLNALSKASRKRVLDLLTKEERREVTTHVLVVDNLSALVQKGDIPAKLVAKHSSIKKSAPYIRVSRQGEAD